MSSQIITIGSCLSFLIACHYNRLKPIKCLSSTRHNRVDKIINTYLEKTQKEIPESLIDLLKFDRDHPDLKQIIDNQFSSRMLGRTALDSESAISLAEIAQGSHQLDLIIYDSYCELLFKLLTSKNGEGTFFLNTASCENWQDFFDIEKERLEISKVVDYYSKFVNFFKSKNKETKLIFINYPFLHHHNQLIQRRNQQLNDLFVEHQYLKENTYFVPAIHIPSEYWMNIAHLRYHNNRNFHDDYALIIKIIMEGHFTPIEWQNFVKNKGDHLLDDMILMSPDFPGYRPPTYSLNFEPKLNQVPTLPSTSNPHKNEDKIQKNLYLHIGFHKTGSTTLQVFLKKNRDLLLENGYLYPESGFRECGQHNLAWQLSGDIRFNENYGDWKSLNSEIKSKDPKNIILSSEDFGILNPESIEKIKSILQPYNLQIIVYIRRQDKLLQSMYAHQVKTGGYWDKFSVFCQKTVNQNRLDFYQRLLPWKENFGIKKIKIIPLENNQLKGGNLCQEFLNCIGCPVEFSQFSIPPHLNSSPSAKTLEVQRKVANIFFNRMDINITKKEINERYLKPILRYSNLNSWNIDRFNQLTPEVSREILNKFEDSNSKVAREYLYREDGKLFYEEIAEEKVTDFNLSELTHEEFLEIVLVLIDSIWQKLESVE